MRLRTPNLRWIGVGVATLVVLSTAGATALAKLTPRRATGATVTWALPPGVQPNWIFPIMSLPHSSVYNSQSFQYLLWKPLFWFGNHGASKFNPQLSLADPPRFSDNARGQTVATITLKSYRWSNGRPVTSRDVQFYMNLLDEAVRLNPLNWYANVSYGFPNNIVAMRYLSPSTFSVTFNGHYSSSWLLYNELSQITPIPQSAWDRTAAGGRVGNFDLTRSGAKAVYDFLYKESSDLGTYATNPLWKVVDGPWLLTTYLSTTGYTAMIPNRAYSGPDPATIGRFVEVPFTTEAAEFDSLRSGQLDYGYMPIPDLAQKGYLSRAGYTFQPWLTLGIVYFPINFTNPVTGPIFDQLYVRQAMAHLVDQPAMITHILKGYAAPTYGPVPTNVPDPFASRSAYDNPYPYSPGAAISLLRAHGWAVHPNGVSTCASPGAGSGHCGAGIASGAAMSFNLQYASGTAYITQEMETLQSDFSLAGIKLSLSLAPFNTVLSNAVPCTPKTGTGCKWDMENWGGGWSFEPDYQPTGGELFATGAGANSGDYSNKINDTNIMLTHTRASINYMFNYEDYLAKQEPVIWIPNADYQLSEVRHTLTGWNPQDPYLMIYPQDWRVSK